ERQYAVLARAGLGLEQKPGQCRMVFIHDSMRREVDVPVAFEACGLQPAYGGIATKIDARATGEPAAEPPRPFVEHLTELFHLLSRSWQRARHLTASSHFGKAWREAHELVRRALRAPPKALQENGGGIRVTDSVIAQHVSRAARIRAWTRGALQESL